MAYWDIPAGSTFGLCRKYIRDMFQDLYSVATYNRILHTISFGTFTDGNYTKFEADGTMVAVGGATTWDDIVGSLISRRLESTVGRLQYNYDENSITMQNNGSISATADRLIFNFQYPHAAKTDGTMNLHLHWEQPNSLEREFTVEYRLQPNGEAKETTWTRVVVTTTGHNVFPYVSGTINQITELAQVDMTDAGISCTVQFRLARTDGSSGDIEATFVDAHVERDMHGSRTEYVK